MENDLSQRVATRRVFSRRVLLRSWAAGMAWLLVGCGARPGRDSLPPQQPPTEQQQRPTATTSPEEIEMNDALSIRNASVVVSLNQADGAFAVRDQRTGRAWSQRPLGVHGAILSAEQQGNTLHYVWRDDPAGMQVRVTLQLRGEEPELSVTLVGEGQLAGPLAYPHPFVSDSGTYLVVPMNEGISYPVEDASIEPMTLIAYGGHGICMAFFGATDGERGVMGLIETSDDAAIRIDRAEGRLCIAPQWDPQKGALGETRRLRYIFFQRGGHVAMAKYYRRYAQEQNRFVTLAQKRDENPNVDRLIGAANVWCWENPLLLASEMRTLGMQHVLWSECGDPATIRAINELGYLTSAYDIYQDVMNPATYAVLQYTHPRWPEKAWPDDLMIGPDGDWIKGWQIEGKDGKMYPCGVACDRQAPPYAQERISRELETLPYNCRFIDTTTASPWRECYHPKHPLTRGESRAWKMELLRLVKDFGLVVGTETGHDAAVPYVHYFEGMLSLGPYRVPDSGRRIQEIWDEVPEGVAKFQMGQRYRLPLWELVFHECVVAHWYWGDYSNKLPALWDKRDLFNVLYGTAPMFMFNTTLWAKSQARFLQSYRNVCPVARAVGYAEMTDHRFLTADRDVQQTAFANGVTITANFSDQPFALPDGVTLAPMGHHIEGVDA